jgi:hypothetical protein
LVTSDLIILDELVLRKPKELQPSDLDDLLVESLPWASTMLTSNRAVDAWGSSHGVARFPRRGRSPLTRTPVEDCRIKLRGNDASKE